MNRWSGEVEAEEGSCSMAGQDGGRERRIDVSGGFYEGGMVVGGSER